MVRMVFIVLIPLSLIRSRPAGGLSFFVSSAVAIVAAGADRATDAPVPRAITTAILLFTTSLGAARASAAPAEIPFEFSDGFITFTARIGERGEPLNVLLDSGA